MRNSVCWAGLAALLVISFSSCASLGSSIAPAKFEKDSGKLGTQFEINLFPMRPQGDVLVDGNQRFKTTNPGDQFVLVNLRVVNIANQAVGQMSSDLVELVYLNPASNDIFAIRMARLMQEGGRTEVNTPTFGKTPLLQPGVHLDYSLAYVLPGKSKVLGVMVDRSLHLDAAIEDEALAKRYQKWMEEHVNAETVIKIAGKLSFPIVKALLDMNSFDINITGRKGLTAFQTAVIFGNVDTAAGLAQAGANTKLTAFNMGDEFSLVHMATTSGNPAMLDWVIGQGADIQTKTHEDRTVFELAVKSGSLDMVKRVVALGFDPTKEKIKMAWNSMSPLTYAKQNDLTDMVQYFTGLGVK